MQSVDWQRIAPEVATQLLGEPSSKKSHEWRYGTHGSLVVNIEAGTWWDFENDVGGGIIDLIKHLNQDVNTVLKQFGYDLALHSNDSLLSGFNPPKSETTSNARSFSREQMIDLYKQAIVKVKYADNFMVLRFPEGHHIKQKYAPFTLNPDSSWSMKRPEGSLPIYFENKYEGMPIILNEGEKALRGCEAIVGDKFNSCTWHGGVNAWKKADWSPIFGKKVYIFPDNDEAGDKCAMELYEYLKENKCKVSVVKPPKTFKEKDDLYDAYERNTFKNAEDFEDYIKNNLKYIPNDDVEFLDYDDMEANDTPPEWLIDTILEKGTVASVYAEPKAGKSFVGISMMLSVATGKKWYDYDTEQAGVLYLCGEGNKSIFKRLLAWEKHFNTKIRKAPFKVSEKAVGILDDKNFDKLLEKAHDAKNELGSLGLIIIDTLQRNFGSGDENSTSDMNQFIQRIDRLKHETGACIMLIHHTGHAGSKSNGIRRGRGSSVLPASVDSEFYIERDDRDKTTGVLGVEEKVMYVKMSQTLNKEDMNMPSMHFRMDTIGELGKNKDKKSAVLVKVEEFELPEVPKVQKPSPQQKPVLEALKNLPLKDEPDSPQDIMYMPADLVNRVQHNNKNLSNGQIAECFDGLKEKGLIHHIPNVGYQHKDYEKIMPDYSEKGDDNE